MILVLCLWLCGVLLAQPDSQLRQVEQIKQQQTIARVKGTETQQGKWTPTKIQTPIVKPTPKPGSPTPTPLVVL